MPAQTSASADKRAKVLAKIRGLLAKTQDNGCTAEESESAFAMAQGLMTKHAVEEAELVAAGHLPSEEIIRHRVKLRYRDEIRRPKIALIGAIAKANNCQVVDATQTHDELWIVGHESEAFFTEMLASAVLMQYGTERTRGWAAYWGPASRFKWVTSFAWGYAQRIHERLQEAVQQEVTGKELVFVGRKGLVQDWMSKNLATVETKGRSVQVLPDAMAAGEEAANRADLSGGRNHVREGADPAGQLQ